MEDTRSVGPDSRLARSAFVSACTGWVLLIVAAAIVSRRSGPVPERLATDGVSTVVGLVGLAGALALIAGIGRGALALLRIRSGQAAGRARARWAVVLGAVPFVLVLFLGVVALLTLH